MYDHVLIGYESANLIVHQPPQKKHTHTRLILVNFLAWGEITTSKTVLCRDNH